MNNPDEETAVAQFGKGDKYFGVAVMMVTMPGLPMFGHGQIQGFTEKYGMEYRRAYWDEHIDEEMVRRHEREIFPLMRRRRLFSGAENFALYDFTVPEGWVDENVFAYSNRAGNERALILYNNAYSTTRGRIQLSTAINTGTGEEKNLVRRGLAEALALRTDEGHYYAFRDFQSGLMYLRTGSQLAAEGLFAELHAYQYHTFLDFREIVDNDGSWGELARRLAGNPVPDIDEAYREMKLEPVLVPFTEVLNSELFTDLLKGEAQARDNFLRGLEHFLTAAWDFTGYSGKIDHLLTQASAEIKTLPLAHGLAERKLDDELTTTVFSLIREKHTPLQHVALAWIAVRGLDHLPLSQDISAPHGPARYYLQEWLLGKTIQQVFRDLRADDPAAYLDRLLVFVLTAHWRLFTAHMNEEIGGKLAALFADPVTQEYLQFNRHETQLWLNKEQLERLLGSLLLTTVIHLQATGDLTDRTLRETIDRTGRILDAAQLAGYRVDHIVPLFGGPPRRPG
jgi:hypothetical protein